MNRATAVARAVAPSGYAVQRERGAQVVALPSVMATLRSAIEQAGTLYGWAPSRPGARAFTGRGTAYGVATADGEWVVRHYRRGGALAGVLRDVYLRVGTPRPLAELRTSEAARGRGVATPQVVAAVVYPAGPVYRADLATRYIPESADLAEAVLGDGRLDAGGRAAAWQAAGALLRSAFAAGLEHADLNLRNILIARREGAPRALLLDLDRAVVRAGAVSDVARGTMLARLQRSRRKLESAAGRRVTEEELAVFTAAVHGADV
jgi:3-deoxy-D-manno-octulosonic acid kinase